MKEDSNRYNVKMLNGLIIKDLSKDEINDGIKKGKFLPSDFVSSGESGWRYLRDCGFKFKRNKSEKSWMMLFYISLVINILMLLMIIWQNGRIQSLMG